MAMDVITQGRVVIVPDICANMDDRLDPKTLTLTNTVIDFHNSQPWTPEVAESRRRLAGSLQLTQIDTLQELGLAVDLGLFNPNMAELVAHSFKAKKIVRVEDAINPREAVFVLLSNVFNRGDDILENEMRQGEKVDLSSSMDSLTIGVDHRDGTPISATQLLGLIEKFARGVAVDTSSWPGLLQKMLASHTQGIEWLSHYEPSQPVPYSLEQALKNRTDIIGSYFTLLATTKNESVGDQVAERYIAYMLATQVKDDIADAYQDLSSQVNPFSCYVSENVEGQSLYSFDEKNVPEKVQEIAARYFVPLIEKYGKEMVLSSLIFSDGKTFYYDYIAQNL